jgi:acylphosphatase
MMEKCYNVSINGKVQDISFRALIEDIARFFQLKGFVFNDIDGSVKMVCCGENRIINEFFKKIRSTGEERGIDIVDIAKEEIPFHIYLPQQFTKLYTDEIADIGRKLDKGNELLKSLPEIKSLLVSFVTEQKEFNTEMHEHNKEMREYNKEMHDHNKRLERILEKIAER